MKARLKVVKAVTTALAKLPFDTIDDAERDGLFESLLAGKFLFDKSISDRLDNAWTMYLDFASALTLSLPSDSGAKPGDPKWIEKAETLKGELGRFLTDLRSDMISSGRVEI